MYRVIAILGTGLLLAACSSASSWLDGMKPEPLTDTVQFESEPSGAEAKTSTGQSCRTPCSLALPASTAFTVTFNLAGYAPETEQVEMVSQGDGTSRLRPNPVIVEMTPAPAGPRKPAPPAKKKKPAAKPKTAAAPKPAATAAAPAAQAAAPASASSPWPAPQQAR